MRKPGSNGAETLRNLRTAAIQLLSEHGYGAMNLRMLAKKVGIQASSLYNYIDSKQQLLFLLCEETTENLLIEFDRTVKPVEDLEDRLRKFVEFHLAYHIVNRKQASVLQMEMRSLTAKNFQAISKIQRAYTDKVRAIVDSGIEMGVTASIDPQLAERAPNGGWMITPRDSAHLTISLVVCGPQFRAVSRCLKVSFRSSFAGGIHRPLGGLSPVNSTASSFRTFSARTLR